MVSVGVRKIYGGIAIAGFARATIIRAKDLGGSRGTADGATGYI